VRSANLDPKERSAEGLLKSAYSMDARAVVFAREEDLRRALSAGAENGGVDLAAVSVDRLAHWWTALRDAAPRTVLLMGRSHGQEALAAIGAQGVPDLRGKRMAAYAQSSSYYFALWVMSRAGLGVGEVKLVELGSTLDAGSALREGKADAAAGLLADLELAARDRGGKVLATTADAPHLVSTVLVARGEFAARYPGAVRRVLRGLLDASARRDPMEGARLLGEVAPYLGDPFEAIRSAPPADLKENLAFFGLSGESPVTYDELFQSAAALFAKIGRTGPVPAAEDTRDIGALRYVSEVRRQ
jgi:ABC-type nitrate/sulfonate/bicarbonate transport system substrate-binding protein